MLSYLKLSYLKLLLNLLLKVKLFQVVIKVKLFKV